jgi:tetratricopeptide (TPR) repeat protein
MIRRILSVSLLLCLFSLGAAVVRAQEPDPAALRKAVQESRLEPARAVVLKNVKLGAGLAMLQLDDGVLLPASPVGARTVEVVFLGKGRIVLEPPDDIEAGQLDLFTGTSSLQEEFTEMVLVFGMDAAVDAMLKRPAATPEAAQVQRGEELYRKWKDGPERKLLNVEGAILLDAAGDPGFQGYFAAWFHGKELGDFLYLVNPEDQEQVTLGSFVPLDATEKEKRKILKEIARQQRKGRMIGLELEDLGQWNTWLSGSLRNKEGKPSLGVSSFEPEKYTLDVSIAERDLRLTGRARIDLRPVIRGARAAVLRMNPNLQVSKVADGSGQGLFFVQTGDDLTVMLPHPAAVGDKVAVVVEYAGSAVDKSQGSYALADTVFWYPHAGTVDRAAYDVTLRWPKKLELAACGRRVDGGEGADGTRWERRSLDFPANGFSFEVGKYRIEEAQAGHVRVRLAFDPDVSRMGKETREEISKAATDAVAYFEELFGPYPLDELTVVTVPRDFSQAAGPGLVTLSSLMMLDFGAFNLLFGLEDRRTVVAHEIAHQWWGHSVGWSSYRDQWISEAMASYAALLFARNRIDAAKDRIWLGPTSGWQSSLLDTMPDGRVIESVGPVVLGVRLFSSKAGDAYQPIVYKKGAVILDMLARSLGEENFPKILKQIVKVAANRPVSTEDFFDLIERITGANLDAFARQYVYGTGLPEVYYTYRFEPAGEGKWVVRGEARQQAPYRYRYHVVKTGRGFDVSRERLDQIKVADSTLVVPVEVAIYDPTREEAKKQRRNSEKLANAIAKGHIVLKGEKTSIEIPLDQDPKDFWLDRHEEVFGRFFNESHNPKRVLLFQAVDAATSGRVADAEALFAKALAAEVEVSTDPANPPDEKTLKREGKFLDAWIELHRARLYLDQGRDGEAQASFDRSRKVLASYSFWFEEDLKVIESRLDIRRGDYERAFKRLNKGLLRRGTLDSTESFVLLAIAAQATGHTQELKEATEAAKENGADLALLGSS